MLYQHDVLAQFSMTQNHYNVNRVNDCFDKAAPKSPVSIEESPFALSQTACLVS